MIRNRFIFLNILDTPVNKRRRWDETPEMRSKKTIDNISGSKFDIIQDRDDLKISKITNSHSTDCNISNLN